MGKAANSLKSRNFGDVSEIRLLADYVRSTDNNERPELAVHRHTTVGAIANYQLLTRKERLNCTARSCARVTGGLANEHHDNVGVIIRP